MIEEPETSPADSSLPYGLAAINPEAPAWFEADYKAAIAAYKALPDDERSKQRNPARDRAGIRFGYGLALLRNRAAPAPNGVSHDAPARLCAACGGPLREIRYQKANRGEVTEYRCPDRAKHSRITSKFD